jgi:hypothetical protein
LCWFQEEGKSDDARHIVSPSWALFPRRSNELCFM